MHNKYVWEKKIWNAYPSHIFIYNTLFFLAWVSPRVTEEGKLGTYIWGPICLITNGFHSWTELETYSQKFDFRNGEKGQWHSIWWWTVTITKGLAKSTPNVYVLFEKNPTSACTFSFTGLSISKTYQAFNLCTALDSKTNNSTWGKK